MSFVPLLAKVGGLALRQVAKPIANTVTRRAHRPGLFRSVCLRIGQTAHRTQVMFTRLGTHVPGLEVKPVREIDEERAIAWCADVLGEVIVFMIAIATSFGVVVFLEWWGREERENAARETAERRRKHEERHDTMEQRVLMLEKQLEEALQLVKAQSK
eukprot:TRINITY_DN43337_c0_g1_i1.p1 TRINITY_DN43337_c0_g1~~TRINITY_DN43337_c0_g1_i1.p1  ORF type:complete len:180 (+),score=35.72 TRINITY_DN43337_c0_g1_i1:69-542(+)